MYTIIYSFIDPVHMTTIFDDVVHHVVVFRHTKRTQRFDGERLPEVEGVLSREARS